MVDGERCRFHLKGGEKGKVGKKVRVEKKVIRAITVTFSGCVENGSMGMVKHGKMEKAGFDEEELMRLAEKHPEFFEYVDLTAHVNAPEGVDLPEAGVLVMNDILGYAGVDLEEMKEEVFAMHFDKKEKMRGKVKDLQARYKNTIVDEAGEADFENGLGTRLSFSDLPQLSKIRAVLGELLGEKAENLFAEANFYYNIDKCGIGWHGDGERKIVIALRMYDDDEADMPIYYQWYANEEPFGDRIPISVPQGCLYIMGEKAAGTDWKTKVMSDENGKTMKIMVDGKKVSKPLATLRHATGCEKYIKQRRPGDKKKKN